MKCGFPRRITPLLTVLLCAGPAEAARQTSILLISIDTLRADHLGCYGYRKARTPNIDGLAKSGTLFTRIHSPVPLTLPAHTSLLSSSYPFLHHVEENGQQVPHDLVMLPAVLKAAGYRTGAFIGGYVLDARFGLNGGFDVYDSPFHLRPDPGEEPPEVKRPADQVLATAAKWLKVETGRPWFAFIHLYDVHHPYSHGGYDAEIASVDDAIGRFQQSLANSKLLDEALIVLTSDHGESLGEHGEETHGYFIYESTMRVPLIVRWPAGAARQPGRIEANASLIDVAPSLLEFIGMSVPTRFQGHSLLRIARTSDTGSDPVYAESLYARDHMGCSALRSVIVGRYKYIDAPKPELYDLESDPNETRNRYEEQRQVAQSLQTRLQPFRVSDNAGRATPASPEVIGRLRSLGYLAGSSRPGNGIDPKDRLDTYLRYGRAIRSANAGSFEEAIRDFKGVLERDPKNYSARFYLAVCQFRLQHLDEAVRALNETLQVAANYSPAKELLATIWLMKKDYPRARQQYTDLVSSEPGNFGAHFNLGILAMREGRSEEARRELEAAVRVDSNSAPAHAALGSVYYSRGELARAAEQLRRAVALDPHDEASRRMLEQISSRRP